MSYIIVFDTEYTSWEGCLQNGWDANKNQHREIIQISAIKYSLLTQKINSELNIFIKPKINPQLSDYIKELTGISQDKIDSEGINFEEGLKTFISFLNGGKCYSYGNDLSVLKENIGLLNVDYDIEDEKFHDIRPMFEKYGVPINDYSSGELHKYFNIEMKGKIHNALLDCHSILESIKALSNKGNGLV